MQERWPELQRERQALWARLSGAARAQFAWPDPGQTRSITAAELAALEAPAADEPAPETFALLVFRVSGVDYVSLTENARVVLRQGAEGWGQVEVNP